MLSAVWGVADGVGGFLNALDKTFVSVRDWTPTEIKKMLNTELCDIIIKKCFLRERMEEIRKLC